MAVYYLVTSALVKLYVRETGTQRVIDLLEDIERDRFAALELSRVEFRAAIRQRQRLGDIADEDAQTAIGRLESQWQSLFLVQPLTAAVVEEAVAVLDRRPLRAYDALQLAGYLILASMSTGPPPVFVCADLALLKAAADEGLETVNPNEESA